MNITSTQTPLCLYNCQHRCKDIQVNSLSNYGLKTCHNSELCLKSQNVNVDQDKSLFARSFKTKQEYEFYIHETVRRIKNSNVSLTIESTLLLPPLFSQPTTLNDYLLEVRDNIILVLYKSGVVIPVILNPTVRSIKTSIQTIIELYDGTAWY